MKIKTIAMASLALGLMAAPAFAQTVVTETDVPMDRRTQREVNQVKKDLDRAADHVQKADERLDRAMDRDATRTARDMERVQNRVEDRVDRVQDRVDNRMDRAQDRVERAQDRTEARVNRASDIRENLSDADRTAAVKAHMMRQRGLDSMRVHVETRDGEVTLTGSVPTEAQSGLAERTAMEVNGVESVDNKLEVRD